MISYQVLKQKHYRLACSAKAWLFNKYICNDFALLSQNICNKNNTNVFGLYTEFLSENPKDLCIISRRITLDTGAEWLSWVT